MGEFYHEGLKTLIATFGSLFNDIIIHRYSDDESQQDKNAFIRVPITFGQVERMLARVRSEPDFANKEMITLPRMAYDFNGINYNPERKLNKMNNVYTRYKDPETGEEDPIEKTWTPVPYDINMNLYILTLHLEDCLQIIEQIVPFFQPDFNVQIIELNDIKRDVKVTLNSVDIIDDYEGSFEDRRLVNATLSFTVKGHLYGPLQETKVIKKSLVNIITPNWDCYTLAETVVPFQAERDEPHVVDKTKEYCTLIDLSSPSNQLTITRALFSRDASDFNLNKTPGVNDEKLPIFHSPAGKLFSYFDYPIFDWVPDSSSTTSLMKRRLSYDITEQKLVGIDHNLEVVHAENSITMMYLPKTQNSTSNLTSVYMNSFQLPWANNQTEVDTLMLDSNVLEIFNAENGSYYSRDSVGVWNVNPEPKFREFGNFVYDTSSKRLGFFSSDKKLHIIDPQEVRSSIRTNLVSVDYRVYPQTFFVINNSSEPTINNNENFPILNFQTGKTTTYDPINNTNVEDFIYSPKPNTFFYDENRKQFWYVMNDMEYMRLTE